MGRCAGVDVGEVREEAPVPDDEVWDRESRPALDDMLLLRVPSYLARILSSLLFTFCLLQGVCVIAASSSIFVQAQPMYWAKGNCQALCSPLRWTTV